MFNIVQIIDKKANKKENTKEEIQYLVENYLSKKIPDYQMSAWLMAVRVNGMSDNETIHYTEALINSGDVIDHKDVWVDKHSTGGIGDKVSLVLAPLAASLGLKMGKLSGRGLGFTGGTLDKLESIKGFNINLTPNEFHKQIDKIGVAIISAMENLAPADKVIYALRDVTGSVQSMPLIAASVMSKKIASGADYIIIDLKVGSGALIHDIKEANKLGKLMKKIGKHFDKEVYIQFSSMDQPLGFAIGNGIEVLEAVETLKNHGPEDLKNLVIKIAAELYSVVKNVSLSVAEEKAEHALTSGKAYEKFIEWMEAQGATRKTIENQDYFKPEHRTLIKANKKGIVKLPLIENFGWLAIELGAGRKEKNDKLDYNSGFRLRVKSGDRVEKYDTLIEIYSSKELDENLLNNIAKEFEIVKLPPKPTKLLLGQIKW